MKNLNSNIEGTSSSVKGWLLDVYPIEIGKVAVWIIDEKGKRIRLTDGFQPSIYISGKQDDLERLVSQLFNNQKIVQFQFTYKYVQVSDIEKSRVLELIVKDGRQIPALTQEILRLGDYLRYELHNCDIPTDRAYLYSHDLFPLAFIEVKICKTGLTYSLLDSVESTNYTMPHLSSIHLDVDIAKAGLVPTFDDKIEKIRLQKNEKEMIIDYGDEATKLLQLVYAVKELDPDIILTNAGDSYLFPYLIHRATLNDVFNAFVLSRDNTPFSRKTAGGRTFFSYGRTFYRAGTIRLYGRIHLDENNTFAIKESGLDGFIELARTCRVPLHTAARFSIGSSMSSIQFYQAIKDDILLPRNKKIPETFKSAYDLLVGDRGGFVFEPRCGVYDCVGELDFSSMYPALMQKYNISAETVLCKCCPDSQVRIPELNYHICTKRVGMVPKTVKLALSKRLKYKRLRDETADKQLKQVYNKRQMALKWVLVTCFGYLGFSNSKFGTVDGHIGVCAFARETLLKAAHIAEDEEFEVLHGIVDSLWLKKKDATIEDYSKLSELISKKIDIPINFEGQYKWIVFLPSKMRPRISVLNRYFGALKNGKIKARGLEVRRRDTPRFIYNAQMDMINALSSADNVEVLKQKIPEALKVVKDYRQKLINGQVPMSDLIISKRLSNSPKHYKQHVSQLIAAEQLLKKDVEIHAGNNVNFLFTDEKNKRFERRVKAEHLLDRNIHPDIRKYLMLLYSSAANLLSFQNFSTNSVYEAIRGYENKTLADYIKEQ